MSLDNVQIFSAKFSEFKKSGQPGTYLLTRQDLLVWLDFSTHRLFVATPKMSLPLGAATAGQNITMTPAPLNSLIYRRTGVVGEP